MFNYKQVILIRQDLKLPKGKMAVQAAHASVEAVLRSDKDIVRHWRSEGMKKVVLKVADLNELRNYERLAKQKDLITAVVTDAGLTTVDPGTTTCMAIGPENSKIIDEITGKLKII